MLADVLSRTLERGGVALLPAFAVDRTPDAAAPDPRSRRRRAGSRTSRSSSTARWRCAALAVYRAALHRGDDEFRPSVTEAGRPVRSRWAASWSPASVEVPSSSTTRRSRASSSPPRAWPPGGRVLHHLRDQLPRSPQHRGAYRLPGAGHPGPRPRPGRDPGEDPSGVTSRCAPRSRTCGASRPMPTHRSWSAGCVSSAEPRTVFVVHGEPSSSQTLATTVRAGLDWTAVVPRLQRAGARGLSRRRWFALA